MVKRLRTPSTFLDLRGEPMSNTNEILSNFGQCTRALIELLHEDAPLETVEQMFIESHLALIRSAFEGWKHRNTPSIK
jgi:hypothetical protein